MDALAGLLDGPRAHGAFLLRIRLRAPWAIDVRDRAPLSLFAQLREPAWATAEGGEPVEVAPGDLLLARGPDPYVYGSGPQVRPGIVVHPGQHCESLDGTPLEDELALGVRDWGHRAGSSLTLVATYPQAGDVSARLLAALPPLLVLRAHEWDSPLLPLLGTEVVRDAPGQEAVLDRLVDLVLVSALRAWFARPGTRAPAWYAAQGDPVVGRALTLLDHNLAHPWTVAELAARCGVSRAALARRFRGLVGETPMAYLTDRRLALAADLLREPGATLGAVARHVGYGSPFALSTAFTRVRGLTPQQHRTTAG